MRTPPMTRYYATPDGRGALAAWYDAALSRLCADVPALESRYIATRFGATHVLLAGDPGAPPLALLHGINVNALSWAAQIRRLSGAFRLIVPDVPGFAGRGDAPRLRYNGDDPGAPGGDYAAWLGDLLDALGVDSAGIVGTSGGGYFALCFAAGQPERAGALTLINPCGLARYRFPLGLLRAQSTIDLIGALGRLAASPALAARLAGVNAGPGAHPSDETRALAELLLRHYRRHRPPPPLTLAMLRRVRAPVRLLLGARDPYFDARVVVHRARRAFETENLAVVVRRDGGHDLHTADADWVAAHLIRGLRPVHSANG